MLKVSLKTYDGSILQLKGCYNYYRNDQNLKLANHSSTISLEKWKTKYGLKDLLVGDEQMKQNHANLTKRVAWSKASQLRKN